MRQTPKQIFAAFRRFVTEQQYGELNLDERREVERLRSAHHPAAAAVERHFKDGTVLPSVHLLSSTLPHGRIDIDGTVCKTKDECSPIAQWMIETGQASYEIGLYREL